MSASPIAFCSHPFPLPSTRLSPHPTTPRRPRPRRPPSPTLTLNPPSSPSPPSSPHPVIVIGGGAAGFFAAITLSRLAPAATRVTILEASPAVLQKVRISGGGRCNVTSALHHHDPRVFAAQYPRGASAMPAILSRFGPADIVRFFEQEGVPLKAEPSGKLFPVSDSSASVVDALVNAATNASVRIRTGTRVVGLVRKPAAYLVSVAGGEVLHAHFVVIATGSARAAHNWAEALGHRIIHPVPSLFTFRIDDQNLHALAGVAVDDCQITLRLPNPIDTNGKKRPRRRKPPGLTQRGPLLITHWGLSGPGVLTLSAFGARELHHHKYRMPCTVDWLPGLNAAEKTRLLRSGRLTLAQKNLATVSPFGRNFPNRLWRYLIERDPTLSPTQKWGSLRNEHIDKLVDILSCSVFQLTGRGEFKEEFVTAGGVALKSINAKTFESRHSQGLYFAGETLDVDGRTGGYNLEFAWSSGFIAGSSIAEKILVAADLEVPTHSA